MSDLFTCDGPLTEADIRRKRKAAPHGYAWAPGTGPAGETCRTCRHYVVKRMGGAYRKCALVRAKWTQGTGTDILARAPACAKWETKE